MKSHLKMAPGARKSTAGTMTTPDEHLTANPVPVFLLLLSYSLYK